MWSSLSNYSRYNTLVANFLSSFFSKLLLVLLCLRLAAQPQLRAFSPACILVRSCFQTREPRKNIEFQKLLEHKFVNIFRNHLRHPYYFYILGTGRLETGIGILEEQLHNVSHGPVFREYRNPPKTHSSPGVLSNSEVSAGSHPVICGSYSWLKAA